MQNTDPGPLQVLEGRDFTPALAQPWLALLDAVWPDSSGPRALDGALERLGQQGARHFFRLSADGRTMLCHSSLFTREMSSGGAAFRVGCLAAVCVLPELRGRGLGREVVLAAFEALPTLAPVLLFQTGVPEFYARLGALKVHSRFVNAQADEPEKNPFWEEHAMIFPGNYAWPASAVDIGGAGF